jgi:3'-phosphoadenosine 5'-phosphosulfate (PAPS) 3'-phosphatase
MGKYGLVARGCGHIYLRFPPASYKECVWDHAPGSLLLKEAGGCVTDMTGNELDFSLGSKLSGNHGVIGTCNPQLHARVLEVLRGQGPAT